MNTLGKKFFITVLINLLFIAVCTYSLEAADLNYRLKGDYKLVLTLSCVTSQNGFDKNLTRIGDGGSFTAHVDGIYSFDGAGNGTFDGSVLVVDHLKPNNSNNPVSTSDLTAEFTYIVNSDGSYNEDKVLTVTRTGGTAVGLINIIYDILPEGQLSTDGEILLLHDSKPNIETITIPDNGTVERICGRSGTAMKIKGSKNVVVIPLM